MVYELLGRGWTWRRSAIIYGSYNHVRSGAASHVAPAFEKRRFVLTTRRSRGNMAVRAIGRQESRGNAIGGNFKPTNWVMESEHLTEQQFADLAAGDAVRESTLAHLKTCPKCQAIRKRYVSFTGSLPAVFEPVRPFDSEKTWVEISEQIRRADDSEDAPDE